MPEIFVTLPAIVLVTQMLEPSNVTSQADGTE